MKVFIATSYTDLAHLRLEDLQTCDVVLFMCDGWITVIKNRWGSSVPFSIDHLGTFLSELVASWDM